MRTVTYRLGDLHRAVIPIGFVGENEHSRILFDCLKVFEEYPSAVAALTVQPPYGEAYPAVVVRDGNIVYWDIYDSDLTQEGRGEAQLTFSQGDVVVKSFIVRTSIERSLMGTGDVPEPLDDFLARAGEALTAIPQTIDDALAAAKASGEFDGADGQDGQDGADGFSPTVAVTEITGGHQVAVTDAEGTTTFDVMDGVDGQNGADGAPGADGFSPRATVSKSGKVATITITDAAGTTTATVSDGEDGTSAIDDTAGAGDTDKVWSADKSASEVSSLNGAIDGINSELGLNGETIDIGTEYPLVIQNQVGNSVELEFTTATSFLKTGVNLISTKDSTFTRFTTINLPTTYPAGDYTFSAVVTSNDTDSTKNLVQLQDNDSVVGSGTIDRTVRSSKTITASSTFNKIVIYASTDYSKSKNDDATFNDMQLEMGETASSYSAYAGQETTVGDKNIITIDENPTIIFSNDYSDVHGIVKTGETPVIPMIEAELFELAWTEIDLTLTEGTYYMPDGTPSTYSSAKSSQLIEVEEAEKLKVTTRSQANVPGILFYGSNSPSASTFISYGCYTGSSVTFTDEIVTVPQNAKYAIVQGNKAYDVVLKHQVQESKIENLDTKIGNVSDKHDSDGKYLENIMCKRLMALGKKSGFEWGTLPRFQLTLRVDDLRADIDKVAKIIMGDYGFPLVVAACVGEINKTATGITDPSEKIGNTRLEVLEWVQEHGGEVVVHPDSTYESADYETSIKPLFLDSLRTFDDNGIRIRGTAVANGFPDATLKKALDPYLYGYYDYADDYGTYAPYTGINTHMISNFHDDASEFETWLNARIADQTPRWRTVVLHQLGDDVSEQTLKDILDIIQTNVNGGNMDVVLWSDVFDTYGT